MKIGIISAQVFAVPVSGYSGLEHLAWQQAKYLALRGHQVILFAPNGSSCPGCQVVHTGEPGWDERVAYGGDGKPGGWGGYWSLLPQMEVVICNDWQKNAYLLKMEGRLKAPVLGVCHAPVDTMFKELPPLEKPCFVCISEDQGNHFRGLFNKDCRVALNGIDTSIYAPLALPRSDRFLFLARFSSVKSPELCQNVCLEAGVGLDMVGDVLLTNEPDLLERCKRRADGKNIRLIGPASRGECVWWFSQARALIHLTPTFREPYGLAPVEAQACGCPVLAWRIGAMSETVKHGETGFLVSSKEEAVEILKSGALDSIDRNKCREWALQFSVERMASRYEQLAVEALAGGW